MKGSYREINKKIKSIKKVFRKQIKDSLFFGFLITLEDDTTIKIFQEEQSLCCEQYDVILLSNFYDDDPNINELKQVETCYINGISWGKKLYEDYKNQLETKTNIYQHGNNKEFYCYIDILTDKGLIQIVCFNYHYGNYPHSVYVEWDNFTDLEHI
jgi:hypothetical protein